MAVTQREDRFTTPEVAEATGVTSRNVMYLCSIGAVPVAEGGHGRGRHRQLDIEGLARVAVIAALYNAGVEIYLASKLVEAIGDDSDVHGISNLEALISRPHSGVIKLMIEQGWDTENAFYLHRAFRRHSNSYTPHIAIAYDRLFEICDRTFVFLNHLAPDSENQTLWPSKKPTALFKISGWRKGDSVELKHALSPPRGGRLPREWADALQNFRGMMRINVSLAIRDALDSIADSRGD